MNNARANIMNALHALESGMYPVEVKTMEAAIDYINMVAALK